MSRVGAALLVGLIALSLAPPVGAQGPLPGIIDIHAGSETTCARTTSGGLQCWGYGIFGSLGDGLRKSSLRPVAVAGLTDVASVAVRDLRTCAVTTAHDLWCWGYNVRNELGNRVVTASPVKIDLEGVSGQAASVELGGHFCVLTVAGGVRCWGGNYYGEVGDGTTVYRATPVDVVGLQSGVRAIAIGSNHTCALTAAGGVKCWGANNQGQLGIGTTTNAALPTDVPGLGNGVQAVSASYSNTCAVKAAGQVVCWGYNGSGKNGNEITTGSALTPAPVIGFSTGATAVSLGGAHTCALTEVGTVFCWGFNRSGQLGNGGTSNRLSPVRVRGLPGPVRSVSAGGEHTCAVLTSGRAMCWGGNTYGQMGNGTRTLSRIPVYVSRGTT